MAKKISITTIKYWENRLDLRIYINILKKYITYVGYFEKCGFKTGRTYTFTEFVNICRNYTKKGGSIE